jgi:hypothetical protein
MTAMAVGERQTATGVPRSPTEALLIESARPRAATDATREIVDLARDREPQWAPTVTLATWHGLAPRLARSLVVSGATQSVPRDVDERLQSAYLATMARNLFLRSELQRVVEELRRRDVEVLLLKGAALVPLVHRDPGVRPMEDLDLLVRREDVARADEVIRSLGYVASASPPVADTGHGSDRLRFEPHHLPALVRPDGRATIELHHKLGSSGSASDFDAAGLWARAVPCSAGAIPCSRPSDEDLLAHLCLHFLVDRVRLFSRRALGQLCDIAAVVDCFADTLDWERLGRDAGDRGNSRALALALGTVVEVLGARVPEAVRSTLASRAGPVPDAADVVTRRVLRDPAWTTLERITSRQPSVFHLLPPNPRRWQLAVDATRPPFGMVEGYARWTGASMRIVVRPAEVAAERRFAAALQNVVYPRGLPDGSTSHRRLRRSLQARLARTSPA